jgi:hypothetical protein
MKMLYECEMDDEYDARFDGGAVAMRIQYVYDTRDGVCVTAEIAVVSTSHGGELCAARVEEVS